MKRRARSILAVGAGGLLIIGMAAAAPAAAVANCSAPFTEVIPGVCQATVNASAFGSNTTVTVPAGIAKVTALVVGGGGAGAGNSVNGAAGGGGGWVSYIDTLSSGIPLTVHAGLGATTPVATGQAGLGDASTITDGTHSTTTNQSGGGNWYALASIATGGSSGGLPGYVAYGSAPYRAGGSGAGSQSFGNFGGSGRTSFSGISGIDSALWPNSSASLVFDTTAGLGRGGDGTTATPNPANAWGAGGSGWLTSGTPGPAPGVDGIVVIRYAAPVQTNTPSPSNSTNGSSGSSTTGGSDSASAGGSAALASTGAAASPWALGGVALIAGAVAILATRARRRV